MFPDPHYVIAFISEAVCYFGVMDAFFCIVHSFECSFFMDWADMESAAVYEKREALCKGFIALGRRNENVWLPPYWLVLSVIDSLFVEKVLNFPL